MKSIFAAWEKGDFSSSAWADPEIEFVMLGGLTSGKWNGMEEMAEAWGEMLRAWENLRAVPDEFRELDDGRVLVLLRNQGRGRGSGIDVGEISVKAANVFTIRGGKVTSLTLYWDRDRAISDLGL
ncbi:MAG TPA: nuclear transport factor 2 family protein [Solirubrobacterales bacterium]|nr:nuclear transport factor 2 family protein [Solirubrobacterales bacterium]